LAKITIGGRKAGGYKLDKKRKKKGGVFLRVTKRASTLKKKTKGALSAQIDGDRDNPKRAKGDSKRAASV